MTWEITRAGSQGLTENNARFGVMRIMRAIQQSQLTAGGDAPWVRLIGRYQPSARPPRSRSSGSASNPRPSSWADFDDRDYLEAFELAGRGRHPPRLPDGPVDAEPAGPGGEAAPVGAPGWPGGSTCVAAGPVARGRFAAGLCASPRPPWRR